MISILVISVSLALDALSVSVAGGISVRRAALKDALKVAVVFGIFQGGMPLIGWLIGAGFSDIVADYSKWIGFVLLSLIGLKMIHEALKDVADKEAIDILSPKTLLLLAIATSIDALIVGVTLPYIDLPVVLSAIMIGVVTFVLSFAGFLLGKHLGRFFEGKVEIIGGIALIAIGVKILVA